MSLTLRNFAKLDSRPLLLTACRCFFHIFHIFFKNSQVGDMQDEDTAYPPSADQLMLLLAPPLRSQPFVDLCPSFFDKRLILILFPLHHPSKIVHHSAIVQGLLFSVNFHSVSYVPTIIQAPLLHQQHELHHRTEYLFSNWQKLPQDSRLETQTKTPRNRMY